MDIIGHLAKALARQMVKNAKKLLNLELWPIWYFITHVKSNREIKKFSCMVNCIKWPSLTILQRIR